MTEIERAAEVLRMADALQGSDINGLSTRRWNGDDGGDRELFAGIFRRLCGAMPVHPIPHDEAAWRSINDALARCPPGVSDAEHAINTARWGVPASPERSIEDARRPFDAESDLVGPMRAARSADEHGRLVETLDLQQVGERLAGWVRRSLWEQCTLVPGDRQLIADAYNPGEPIPSEPAALAAMARQRAREVRYFSESAETAWYAVSGIWPLAETGVLDRCPDRTRVAVKDLLSNNLLRWQLTEQRWNLAGWDADESVMRSALKALGRIGLEMRADGLLLTEALASPGMATTRESGALGFARRNFAPIVEALTQFAMGQAESIERGEVDTNSDHRAIGANANTIEQADLGLRDANWFSSITSEGLPADTLSKAARNGRLRNSVQDQETKRWRHSTTEVAMRYTDFATAVIDATRTNTNEREPTRTDE